MAKVREGRWDCPQCGTKEILGRHKICTNCGKPRPDNVRFYLPEDEAEVADKAVVQQASIGPDWICQYCGADNQATMDVCRQCNAPRGDAASRQVVAYAAGAVPRSGEIPRPTPTPAPAPAAAGVNPLAGKIFGLPAPLVLGGGFLLLCAVCFFLFIRTNDVEATVTGFAWERTIAIEELRTVTEQGWDLPADARPISQERAIRTYEQVISGYTTEVREVPEQVQVGERTYVCGQRDLGNGFFEDVECTEPVYETQYREETVQVPIYVQRPIYDTQYTYEIDRWEATRTVEAGDNDHNPEWPATNLAENEREGERTERYVVRVAGGDEDYEIEIPLERWTQLDEGDAVTVRVTMAGVAELVE